jgi:hypothetical protein
MHESSQVAPKMPHLAKSIPFVHESQTKWMLPIFATQLTQKNELTDQKSVCDCQKGNTKGSPIHFVSAVHRLSSLP